MMAKMKIPGIFTDFPRFVRLGLPQNPRDHTKKGLGACGAKGALGSDFPVGCSIKSAECNLFLFGDSEFFQISFWSAGISEAQDILQVLSASDRFAHDDVHFVLVY